MEQNKVRTSGFYIETKEEPDPLFENHSWPEMNPIEKEVLLEWLSLGINNEKESDNVENINEVGEQNLLNLSNILIRRYNNTDKSLSPQNRVKSLDFKAVLDQNGDKNIYFNPLCTILMYCLLMDLRKRDGKSTDYLKNKMVEAFEKLLKHYFPPEIKMICEYSD